MKLQILAFVCLIFGVVACNETQNTENNVQNTGDTLVSNPKSVIIAYVVGSPQYDVNQVNFQKLTHINYAFANVRDGILVSEAPELDSINFVKLNAKRSENPDIQLLISAGGWSWSKNFSDVALTDSSRQIFAKSAIEFVKKYNLDGLDIDWEYPALEGDNNTNRPEDKTNYTLFMQLLREKLDELGQENNRNYLLTGAVGGFPEFLENTEMDKVAQVMDYINIMTYDFYTGGNKISGHHSNLALHPNDGKKRSVLTAVEEFIQAGVPAEKLVIGGAFYGRGNYGVTDSETKVYVPATGEAITAGYAKLKADYIDKNSFKRYWDDVSKSPYLFSEDSSAFISYDDPQSLKLKAEFVQEKGLGGVMFWQYFGDDNEELLDAFYYTLNKK